MLFLDSLSTTENVFSTSADDSTDCTTDADCGDSEYCVDGKCVEGWPSGSTCAQLTQDIIIMPERIGRGEVYQCDEETGNWTVIESNQTTDKEWIVEQGCDAPTHEQFNDKNLAEMLNDYGQVVVTEEEDATFIGVESSGHDDPNASSWGYSLRTDFYDGAKFIADKTNLTSASGPTSGRVYSYVNSRGQTYYSATSITLIEAGVEVQFTIKIEPSGNYSSDVSIGQATLASTNTIKGTVSTWDINGWHIDNLSIDFNIRTGIVVSLSVVDLSHEAAHVVQQIGDPLRGSPTITNVSMPMSKGDEPGSARSIAGRAGHSQGPQTFLKVKTWSISADELNPEKNSTVNNGSENQVIRDTSTGDGNTTVENERTGLVFLKGKEVQVGFGEDGEITQANVIRTNLSISGVADISDPNYELAYLVDGGGWPDNIDTTVMIINPKNESKADDGGGGYAEISCVDGMIVITESLGGSDNRLSGDGDGKDSEDEEILYSAGGVDVTRRDGVVVGGTFAVTSILWMVGRRFLSGA